MQASDFLEHRTISLIWPDPHWSIFKYSLKSTLNLDKSLASKITLPFRIARKGNKMHLFIQQI